MSRILKFSGISLAALSSYLVLKKESPEHFFNRSRRNVNNLIENIADINDKKQNLTDSINKLKKELMKSQMVINSVNKDVEMFNFKINPRIKRIDEKLNELNQKFSH
ncbi:hypothetical protein [Apilactobacillus ozensis]|uniref:hypothetical protein n=1 Tax=Apilactobacillus ozensis TaxID=866801 RepID=UPI00200B1087|nr:hypothetical protein [Apilactobacillus ozensis]MCK8606646.1 hypothetical protein [Apilactobacillus ozensis]